MHLDYSKWNFMSACVYLKIISVSLIDVSMSLLGSNLNRGVSLLIQLQP